jgi:hypothetical protein
MFEKVNIYLDDIREAPSCFIRTFTVEETIELLKKHNGNIGILSLDNDLGDNLAEGRKVIDWIDEQFYVNPDYVLPDGIEVHSANGPAGKYMRSVIHRLYMSNK